MAGVAKWLTHLAVNQGFRGFDPHFSPHINKKEMRKHLFIGRVVELVDSVDSKSTGVKAVWVQVPPRPPKRLNKNTLWCSFLLLIEQMSNKKWMMVLLKKKY